MVEAQISFLDGSSLPISIDVAILPWTLHLSGDVIAAIQRQGPGAYRILPGGAPEVGRTEFGAPPLAMEPVIVLKRRLHEILDGSRQAALALPPRQRAFALSAYRLIQDLGNKALPWIGRHLPSPILPFSDAPIPPLVPLVDPDGAWITFCLDDTHVDIRLPPEDPDVLEENVQIRVRTAFSWATVITAGEHLEATWRDEPIGLGPVIDES